MHVKPFIEDEKLVITWRQTAEHPRCVHSYRYSLKYDYEMFENQETTNLTIELPFKPCAAYSISVWSVGLNGSISKTVARHEGVTPANFTELPEVNTSLLVVNETCLLTKWFLPTDFRMIHCIGFYQIHLQPQTVSQLLVINSTNDDISAYVMYLFSRKMVVVTGEQATTKLKSR